MSTTGTHMTEQDYEILKVAAQNGKSAGMSDAEAALLVNRDFGFEASKIEILHEAEVDVTEPGSRYVRTKQVPRPPMYAATDWNYVRFNVHGAPAIWYYEMINAQLYPVLL